jgi:acyl-CoA synthetase (NDP forming)
VVRNLVAAGFSGPLHLVNVRGGEVAGRPTVRSIADVEGEVELAVIAVPANAVVDVARACATKGVRALVVLTGGFAQVGPEGRGRQDELLAVCRAAGMRMVGPNCLGVASPRTDIALNATFAPSAPTPGDGHAPGGPELIVGAVRDPAFDPLVACGAGGVTVELVGDIQVRLAPLGPSEAHGMLRDLKTFPLLDGYRGRPRTDLGSLRDLIMRVGGLAATHPAVAELDLNPVIATPAGALVVNARVRVDAPGPAAPFPALNA